MTVVVTGACGFIGSHIVEALLESEEADVIGVDQRSLPKSQLEGRGDFRFLHADAGSSGVVETLPGVSVVVHLAAPTDVEAS